MLCVENDVVLCVESDLMLCADMLFI